MPSNMLKKPIEKLIQIAILTVSVVIFKEFPQRKEKTETEKKSQKKQKICSVAKPELKGPLLVFKDNRIVQ